MKLKARRKRKRLRGLCTLLASASKFIIFATKMTGSRLLFGKIFMTHVGGGAATLNPAWVSF